MIIFFENGRLGNQLFQFFGLKQTFKGKKILLVGFDSLFSIIEADKQILRVPKLIRKKKLLVVFNKILIFLSHLRIISKSWENTDDSRVIEFKRGLFSNIIYFSFGFFQNNNISASNFNIKQDLIKKRDSFYEQLNVENKEKVFLHIRRGDYLSWPNKNFPAVLGIDWYKMAIETIKEKIPNCYFVVFSDDIQYAEDFFRNDSSFYFSKNNEIDDFLFMTSCDHGVLSASSFAYWAAFCVKQKNNDAQLIAPKFWIGHRRNIWIPENFKSSWLSYK